MTTRRFQSAYIPDDPIKKIGNFRSARLDFTNPKSSPFMQNFGMNSQNPFGSQFAGNFGGMMPYNEDTNPANVLGKKLAGGAGGAASGALLGALIGSIIPGPGTAAGAMLGAKLGGGLGLSVM